MKRIVLGTAGHIDHGKTALIEALTGINTDRLKEEKLRGITIELGFAHLSLPGGQRIGIVDVPGHERFVKTMVAGAAGIDLVMMVIAADEGVMPQTREHLDICRLLNVKSGLVALTKIDLVDEEWLELVEEDIRGFVKGSFLEDKPIVRVSSLTREGIPQLLCALEALASNVEERSSEGYFRLPIDRVFIMKGFGTVVTGTLISGSISVGEAVEIAPSGMRAKVRGIQVHNEDVEFAVAGQRTAINLQGVDKDRVARGDMLVPPGLVKPSNRLDVKLQHLHGNSRPLRNRTRIRFHAGTSEVLGRVILLDRDELQPGQSCFAQLRLEKPVALRYWDRFVIRSYSPVHTIGGGIVLHGSPKKHRRFAKEVLADLEEASGGGIAEAISLYAKEKGYVGITGKELKAATGVEEDLEKALSVLVERGILEQVDADEGLFIHRQYYDKASDQLLGHLEGFHSQRPLEAGIPKEELRSKLPAMLHQKVFLHLVRSLESAGEIAFEGDRVRLTSHRLSLKAEQKEILERIEQAFRKGGLEPPGEKALEERLGADRELLRSYLELLAREGRLVKVKEGMHFHAGALSEIREKLVRHLKERGEINPSEFKQMARVSRKYMIPLLEYFDAVKLTLRVGDKRILREGGSCAADRPEKD